MTIFINNDNPTDNKDEKMDNFEDDTGIEIIDNDDSLEDLEKDFDEFHQMNYRKRKTSDAKSMEIRNMTNDEWYYKRRAELLSKNDNNHAIIIAPESGNVIQSKTSSVDFPYDVTKIKEKKKQALDWAAANNRYVIVPTNSLEELEKNWADFCTLTAQKRRIADDKSVELFKLKNQEHYNLLKAKLMQKEKPIDPDDIKPSDDNLEQISTNRSTIEVLDESIKLSMERDNKTAIIQSVMELSKIQPSSFYEGLIISKMIEDAISYVKDDISDVYENMVDLPYYTPDEMNAMGVFSGENNFYGVDAYTPPKPELNPKQWADEYSMMCVGMKPAKFTKVPLWIRAIDKASAKLRQLKDRRESSIEEINSVKQYILELGWNPEVEFNLVNRKLATEMTKIKLKNNCPNCKVVDIREMCNIADDNELITESFGSNKIPMYVVLSYSDAPFSKLIKKYTNCTYSHSAISFDADLHKIYSYNLMGGASGFSIENIDLYKKINDKSKIAVFVTYISKDIYNKIMNVINDLLGHIRDAKYSILNIFGLAIGKDIEFERSMICSQFVDRILKLAGQDVTNNKPSGTVTPADIYRGAPQKMFLLYEGPVTEYNHRKVANTVAKLGSSSKVWLKEQNFYITNEAEYIDAVCENIINFDKLTYLDRRNDVLTGTSKLVYENFIKDLISLDEAKEFPVQFDKDGNLLIKNMKKLDYELEYSKSHKLLMAYSKANNIEGIKYELSKLWFMNSIIEQQLYSKKISDTKKVELTRVRARILNDYNKYLSQILKVEPKFNFTEYYNNTPFSDANIKISKHTIRNTVNLIKGIVV